MEHEAKNMIHDSCSMIHDEAGQSMIETILAIFVLATALVAGLGLAVFAFSQASLSTNEVVASNLSREGVEVVRMMRDSNWLAGDAAGGAYALTTCADISSKQCYPQAFNGPFANINQVGQGLRLSFNSSTSTWALEQNANYNLYLQADGTYTHTINGTSVFARRIIITSNTASPYTVQNPELIVQSVVGWRDKKCNWAGQDPATASSSCKVIVEEHLTNWKDYK